MLGSTEDAEDVLQEVFVNAYRAMLADEREINLRPWLYRIARNRCLNHLRKPTADAQESMDMVPMVEAASTAEKVHNREEFRQLLTDVCKLPETQRSALLLREMDAMSYEEIAQAMDTSVPSVKSLLVRARISLAEASQARQLTCGEVRLELAEAAEGLRKVSGPVRRHVRDCDECSDFRSQVRSNDKVLAALFPAGALLALKGFIAGKLGLGGASGGAGAGAAGAGRRRRRDRRGRQRRRRARRQRRRRRDRRRRRRDRHQGRRRRRHRRGPHRRRGRGQAAGRPELRQPGRPAHPPGVAPRDVRTGDRPRAARPQAAPVAARGARPPAEAPPGRAGPGRRANRARSRPNCRRRRPTNRPPRLDRRRDRPRRTERDQAAGARPSPTATAQTAPPRRQRRHRRRHRRRTRTAAPPAESAPPAEEAAPPPPSEPPAEAPAKPRRRPAEP